MKNSQLITERRRAPVGELDRLNRALRTTSFFSQAMAHAATEAALIADVCRGIVEEGRFKMAWVGYAEDDKNKSVRPVAHAGFEQGYLEKADITWADTERGRGPTGSAIRLRQPVACRNILNDSAFQPWREEAVKRGYASSLVLPLVDAGRAFGALSVYAVEPDAFDAVEVRLLAELANDLAFAIRAHRTRNEHQRMEESLRRSEAELKEAQRIAHVGSWWLDLATNEVRWTEELYRMQGLDPTLPPPPYTEHHRLFTPESWRRLSTALSRTQESGVPYELELELVRPDVSHGWMLARGEPVRNKDKVIVGLRGSALDITERKQATEQLEMLKVSIDKHFDSAYWMDTGNRFIYVNDTACKTLGYTRDELLGQPLSLISPQATPQLLQGVWNRLREVGLFTREGVHRRKDGSEFPVEFVSSFVRFEGQEFNCGFARDITERKRVEMAFHASEQSLRESERKFRGILETVSLVGVILDRDSRITLCNDYILAITGWKRAEVLNQNWFDLFIPPDVRETITHAVSTNSVTTGTLPEHFENEIVTRQRERRLIAWNNIVLRNADGSANGVAAIGEDITDRRRAEAALRQEQALFAELARNIPDRIYFKDRQSRFIRINDAQARHFGLGDPAEAIGKSDLAMFGAAHAKKALTDEQRIMETGEPMVNYEEKETWPDGRVTWASSTKVPLRDAEGKVTGLVGISRDITEKKLFEEKFLHTQRLESLGMLAAGIAHDLNNVLTPIMFAAPLLRDSATLESDLRILRTIENSVARGSGLVKQILGFVHSTTGELRIVELKHVAQDVTSLVGETFPKNIRFEHQIPSDLWPVMGNPTQMHQVLLNLCVNARDAMPQGGKLTISAANRRLSKDDAEKIPGGRPGNWLVIEVTDTGMGIPPDVLAHIWDPFFTTKGVGKGTGLGLSTVRGIVTSHQGFIQLETEVGRGTTFRVFLPGLESELTVSTSNSPVELPGGNGELILIVDDDSSVCDLVRTTLQHHNYRVLACNDGVEAIEIFSANQNGFAMVITDVDMPRLGGADLVRMMLQLRPDLPVLTISGSEANAGIPAARNLARTFLQKPFKVEELMATVHGLLHPPENCGS